MTEENNRQNAELMELTADIVAAFVQNNAVPVADLPDLISSVNSALVSLVKPSVVEQPKQTPAVNPKKSVFPDHIISLEDGRKFKSMKRHLGLLGMTPDEYRAKWGLARDYPMVAPSYAAQRSELAKASGLGRKVSAKMPTNKKAPTKKAPAKRVSA
ncbi:MucR family transcriptional regulator [Mesorhizobium sp. C280B]|uniref:MucR family transcriptional regulator n=1 Tax=unclassified Mesorhizobium TaxID=325217 RepID=UPI0003CE64DF|nr:MucR family transcriptional regulator [Mesorhizobium sp. LSJC280B00]ESW77255.1 MucR family transcriptional regulator [Mesorhizobium sp. LSJC280B00]